MAFGELITTVTVPATAASAAVGAYDLVDLATAKDDLAIDNTFSDKALQRYITSASVAAKEFCNRVFQQEFLIDEFWPKRDRYPGLVQGGLRPLQLSRYPLTSSRCLAGIAAPSAPILSAVSSGALAAATYYVRVTYLTAAGETVTSLESTLAVAANNVLQVASPAAASSATGWNVYIGTAANVETLQNSSPIAIGTAFTEPTSGLIKGDALPDFVSVIEDGNALIEGIDFRVDFLLGQLTRLSTGLIDGQPGYTRHWPALPIAVSYGAGYESIPVDVQDAVLRMVKSRWFSRQRDPSLRSENVVGAYEAQYWFATGTVTGNFTPDVLDLLNNYRVPVIL